MFERYTDWKAAHTAAVLWARKLNKDIGIERMKEYGRDGYNLRLLPRPENRCGHELRCEVVTPNDPL